MASVTLERRTLHDAQELMREREFVAIKAVVAHEQPAGQPLLDAVAAVGHGRIGGLDLEGLHVTEKIMQGGALPHRFP